MIEMKELKKVNSDLRFARKRMTNIRDTYKGLYYIREENKYTYTFEFLYLKIEKNINHYAYFIDNLLVNEKRTKNELKKQCSILGEEIIDPQTLTCLLEKLNVNFAQKENKIMVNKEELNEKIKLINNIKNF